MLNPDGSLYVGQVWPGYTVFPDWIGAVLNGTGTIDWWTVNWHRGMACSTYDTKLTPFPICLHGLSTNIVVFALVRWHMDRYV